MAKVYGAVIASCPKCRKPIGDKHPYSWCIECGTTLPDSARAHLPHLPASVSAEPANDVAPYLPRHYNASAVTIADGARRVRRVVILQMVLATLALPTMIGSCAVINFAGATPGRDVFGYVKESPPERNTPSQFRTRSMRRAEMVDNISDFFFSMHGLASMTVGLLTSLPLWAVYRYAQRRHGIDIYGWTRAGGMEQPWAGISFLLAAFAIWLWNWS